MPSNRPLLEESSPRERALAKMWQGGLVLFIGGMLTAVSIFMLGVVWFWTVIVAVVGLFWLLAGLFSFMSGYE
jgi:hypothetical protein